MRIGILGGTFDPVHIGHLVVAEEVLLGLGLAQVLFVPAGQPWLKSANPVSPARHRVEMVRLAISGKPYFRLSTVEVERDGPSYTVDTISDLQSQLGEFAELYFILGWDSLAGLPRWWQPERLIKMCRLVAVPRPSYPAPSLKDLEAVIPGLSRRVILMDKPEIDISATEIRERVAQGLSVSHLVPESVANYIRQNQLYSA